MNFLATLESFRLAPTAALVRDGADTAVIRPKDGTDYTYLLMPLRS